MDTQQTSLTMQHPIAYGARGNAQALEAHPQCCTRVSQNKLDVFLSIAYSRDRTHVRIMHSSNPA